MTRPEDQRLYASSEMKNPEYEWDDLRYFLALYRATSISGTRRVLVDGLTLGAHV
jgi:hypothetical protein